MWGEIGRQHEARVFCTEYRYKPVRKVSVEKNIPPVYRSEPTMPQYRLRDYVTYGSSNDQGYGDYSANFYDEALRLVNASNTIVRVLGSFAPSGQSNRSDE
jgi:hypothetical protein